MASEVKEVERLSVRSFAQADAEFTLHLNLELTSSGAVRKVAELTGGRATG